MSNNVSAGNNFCVAKQTATITDITGFAANCRIIYQLINGVPKQWQPGGGSFNDFTQLTLGLSYQINFIAAADYSEHIGLPEGGSGTYYTTNNWT